MNKGGGKSTLTRDFIQEFIGAQFDEQRELCGQIHAVLPLVTFHGHCEVSAKTCPNFDYKAVLGLDAAGRLT